MVSDIAVTRTTRQNRATQTDDRFAASADRLAVGGCSRRSAPPDYYDPQFVSQLFDEMARTYGFVNLVSSFGFARRWRRQCARAVAVPTGARILDLMTGMAELCHEILPIVGDTGRVTALDISPEMCRHARERSSFWTTRGRCCVDVVQANALDCPLDEGSFDFVLSSFGLKTFAPPQIEILAREIARVLRPGGQFSLLEISVPPSRVLAVPYLFYLHRVIPLIGRLFLGNPENYRMLGIYTNAFGNCCTALDAFEAAGLRTSMKSYFFGCATALVGHKPDVPKG